MKVKSKNEKVKRRTSLRGTASEAKQDRSNLKNVIASPSARNDAYCFCIRPKVWFYLLPFYFCLLTFVGCDAFVRKFTRKPKKDPNQRIEQVIEPKEYVAPAPEDQYAQSLLFWKSWQDELINALNYKSSQKKQLACATEALKNLNKMRSMLSADEQKKMDEYISDMNDIKSSIERDAYSQNAPTNARSAERIKRLVLKDFSLRKVTDDIRSPEPGPAGN